jgi:hypothetical protein
MNNTTIVSILLRVGIAFSFLYAAIQSFRDPVSWIGFFPVWLQDFTGMFMEIETLLAMFSVVEIIVAIWILSGWRGLYSGFLGASMVAGIVVTNFAALDILFRDIPIVFSCLAYAFLSRRGN